MFAGHVGAAMAIARAEPRLNLGLYVFAAVLLDCVLWLLVLLGFESVAIPPDFARRHQPQFVFPWSHGLVAGIAWSALAAAAVYLACPHMERGRGRAAALVAAAVFSHWLLDALVHGPELPVAGDASTKLGLGLWNTMPLALLVEAAIALAGLWLYVGGSGRSRGRKIGLCVLMLVVLASTVVGMTVAPPPPSVAAMAWTSLVTIAVVCLLAAWLGKAPA